MINFLGVALIMDMSTMSQAMRDLDLVFSRLAQSRFRSRFKLGSKEREYLEQRGLDTVLDHARDFIVKRLAPAIPKNDGKQTPMRGHPIFITQHATATCCRGCLAKWYGIPAGHELTQQQQEHIVAAIRRWLQVAISQPTTGTGGIASGGTSAASSRE
ncbi:DUF4186 domain-containing protein [Novosphingobium rosa]|uniref:DUF4186 domain-containing protein n=1 Tax=Novosphingobium rosa TaxID=76978 RepID=UPI000AAB8602|nr:DUF4186 domain-containing protein [Novosphingobium rosa]